MSETNKPLAGKTAVITGAGRGIGRSIAIAYARAGANLAICARSIDELEATCQLAQAEGSSCLVENFDVTDPQATEKFCRNVTARFDQVDILVNNAGAGLERATVAQSDPDLWWKTVEVNVRGPYLVTRHLLDSLAEGAKVINISSGMGLRPGNWNSSYHVSKAGLHMFTEALANELWPRGIDVNNLVPGPVATSLLDRGETESRSTPEQVLSRFAEELPPEFPPCERIKHPDAVAELALYLALQPVGGPTGQSFSLARRPL